VNHNNSATSSTRAGAPRRFVAKIQGVFYAASGVWPWVHGDSFQKVTGYKADFWLAQTVGLLVLVIGGVLYLAARADRLTREIVLLAMLSAAGLLLVDVYTQFQPHTTRAYILDALAEAGLLIAWTLTGRTHAGSAVAPRPEMRHEGLEPRGH
jgi:peptidoglycan/LPS O-acetylase OafA/YrhL